LSPEKRVLGTLSPSTHTFPIDGREKGGKKSNEILRNASGIGPGKKKREEINENVGFI